MVSSSTSSTRCSRRTPSSRRRWPARLTWRRSSLVGEASRPRRSAPAPRRGRPRTCRSTMSLALQRSFVATSSSSSIRRSESLRRPLLGGLRLARQLLEVLHRPGPPALVAADEQIVGALGAASRAGSSAAGRSGSRNGNFRQACTSSVCWRKHASGVSGRTREKSSMNASYCSRTGRGPRRRRPAPAGPPCSPELGHERPRLGRRLVVDRGGQLVLALDVGREPDSAAQRAQARSTPGGSAAGGAPRGAPRAPGARPAASGRPTATAARRSRSARRRCAAARRCRPRASSAPGARGAR